jgi:ATP-dependent helicase Lhr and Lhr-like helicase
VLERRGPSFYIDLIRDTRLLPAQVEAALAELVAGGLITSDGFAGLRTLLRTAKDRDRVRRRARGRVGFGTGLDAAGRWALASLHDEEIDVEKRAEEQARVLLQRSGVVFRKLVEREPGLVPWRDLLWALRRLEARGEVRGGRFVAGFSGEQFAMPDVVSELRAIRREELKQTRVVLSAVDPLNLTGSVVPGARIPAVLGHRILFEDGLPIAVLDGNGVRVLNEGAYDAGEIDGMLRRRGKPARLWGRRQPSA